MKKNKEKKIIQETLSFIPNPNNVLVKCSKKSFEELFYKWIKRDDGSKVQLFTSIEQQEGYDQRFTQNLSTGIVIAVGENIKDIYPSDLIILDYLVYNSLDERIGFVNGDLIVSLPAITTYHTEDAPPSINLRRAYVVGDIDELSKILGIIRNDKLIARTPYTFLEHKVNRILKVHGLGIIQEEKEVIAVREILSASPQSGYKDGDKIFLMEENLWFRQTGDKVISVCFERDIMGKK